jgi:hypothetical protein
VNAWTGQYQMSGATGTGTNPGQPTLADLLNPTAGDPFATAAQAATNQSTQPAGSTAAVVGAEATPVGGQADTGGNPVRESPGYTLSPAGTQAPVDAYNYQRTPSGQTQVYPPGVSAESGQHQVSTTVPLSPAAAQAAGETANNAQPVGAGATTATAGAEAGMSPVNLSPNQINAENYKNTNKAAQNLMWQYFEDQQGWAPGAAQDAFLKSLPRYGGPKQGTVSAGLGF